MGENSWFLDNSWDVVIVGSGIGGAVAAQALANQGSKVLLIERGKAADLSRDFPQGTPQDLPLWTSKILDLENGRTFNPFLGEGVGGSSRLYGMVMERLTPKDFQDQGGRWPGELSDWTPFFDESEKLFHLKSAPVEPNFAPLFELITKRGLGVRPLKLAYHQKKNCEYCQSSVCQKFCRIDAWTGPLEKMAISGKPPSLGQLALLTGTEALELVHLNGTVRELRCLRRRQDGQAEQVSIRGQKFVLAAGALRTPILLQKAKNLGTSLGFSELKSIGHYLMRHFVDLYTLSWPEWNRLSLEEKAHLARVKAWGTETILGETGERLGIFQSFGSLPPQEYIWKEFQEQFPRVQWIPGIRQILASLTPRLFRYPTGASLVEDEPQETNFVRLGQANTLEIQYSISPADHKRIIQMRTKLTKILGKNIVRFFPEAHNNCRLAHACGTCRMGQDVLTSVTDEFGQVHQAENLWIADASVFPSSTDKNPSMTISAHALRMAQRMGHHRGQKSPSE
jgi:choline dehydrogenase-like flavoprotein